MQAAFRQRRRLRADGRQAGSRRTSRTRSRRRRRKARRPASPPAERSAGRWDCWPALARWRFRASDRSSRRARSWARSRASVSAEPSAAWSARWSAWASRSTRPSATKGRVKDGGVLLSVHCDTSDEVDARQGHSQAHRRQGHLVGRRGRRRRPGHGEPAHRQPLLRPARLCEARCRLRPGPPVCGGAGLSSYVQPRQFVPRRNADQVGDVLRASGPAARRSSSATPCMRRGRSATRLAGMICVTPPMLRIISGSPCLISSALNRQPVLRADLRARRSPARSRRSARRSPWRSPRPTCRAPSRRAPGRRSAPMPPIAWHIRQRVDRLLAARGVARQRDDLVDRQLGRSAARLRASTTRVSVIASGS